MRRRSPPPESNVWDALVVWGMVALLLLLTLYLLGIPFAFLPHRPY